MQQNAIKTRAPFGVVASSTWLYIQWKRTAFEAPEGEISECNKMEFFEKYLEH